LPFRTSSVHAPPEGRLLTDRPAIADFVPFVRAAQQGDREAFAELYRRFGRLVHAILLARVPYDAAADLAQEVFLQGWAHIGTLREPAAFGGWIGAMARRRALDYRRREGREVVLTDRYASRESPDAMLDATRALAVIRMLPDTYRETLTLRLIEGCSGAEIAAVTGLTPASVRVNLHRGFKLLRERLEGQR
jgi:RNA polymerase sigma-70 factor (ECF subfamily)